MERIGLKWRSTIYFGWSVFTTTHQENILFLVQCGSCGAYEPVAMRTAIRIANGRTISCYVCSEGDFQLVNPAHASGQSSLPGKSVVKRLL